VAVFVFGGEMHWTIKSPATMRVVTMVFAATTMLVPSARPDAGPKKGESTRVDRSKGGMDNIGGDARTARTIELRRSPLRKRQERNGICFARGST
jgi:hypothetical protein